MIGFIQEIFRAFVFKSSKVIHLKLFLQNRLHIYSIHSIEDSSTAVQSSVNWFIRVLELIKFRFISLFCVLTAVTKTYIKRVKVIAISKLTTK